MENGWIRKRQTLNVLDRPNVHVRRIFSCNDKGDSKLQWSRCPGRRATQGHTIPERELTRTRNDTADRFFQKALHTGLWMKCLLEPDFSYASSICCISERSLESTWTQVVRYCIRWNVAISQHLFWLYKCCHAFLERNWFKSEGVALLDRSAVKSVEKQIYIWHGYQPSRFEWNKSQMKLFWSRTW